MSRLLGRHDEIFHRKMLTTVSRVRNEINARLEIHKYKKNNLKSKLLIKGKQDRLNDSFLFRNTKLEAARLEANRDLTGPVSVKLVSWLGSPRDF